MKRREPWLMPVKPWVLWLAYIVVAAAALSVALGRYSLSRADTRSSNAAGLDKDAIRLSPEAK